MHPSPSSPWPSPILTTPPALDAAGAGDWALLFGAVIDRLRGLGTGAPAAAAEAKRWSAGTPPPQAMGECVAALEQLQSLMAGQLQHGRDREHALQEALTQLAALRAALEGSRADERLAHQRALHDDLTTLPNRVHFHHQLEQALLRESPSKPGLTLLYLDLDEFKQVNDLQGHRAGDQVLRIVAARLKSALRSGDLVCRLGGDEFACMLLGTMSRDQLSHLARKLLDAIDEPIQVGQVQCAVRLSIGVAVHPGDGTGADELLAHADAAMYRAKRLRSGYSFFDRRLDACATAA